MHLNTATMANFMLAIFCYRNNNKKKKNGEENNAMANLVSHITKGGTKNRLQD